MDILSTFFCKRKFRDNEVYHLLNSDIKRYPSRENNKSIWKPYYLDDPRHEDFGDSSSDLDDNILLP